MWNDNQDENPTRREPKTKFFASHWNSRAMNLKYETTKNFGIINWDTHSVPNIIAKHIPARQHTRTARPELYSPSDRIESSLRISLNFMLVYTLCRFLTQKYMFVGHRLCALRIVLFRCVYFGTAIWPTDVECLFTHSMLISESGHIHLCDLAVVSAIRFGDRYLFYALFLFANTVNIINLIALCLNFKYI